MRIIHTADWHLGQRLAGRDRSEEHAQFLNWLIDTVEKEGADALVVAGDIFDTATPAQATMQLYFDFLTRLSRLEIPAVLVAGNHDSPAQLCAPGQLLKRLEIHVIGTPPEDPADAVIQFGKDLAVAAVPYLRERDLCRAAPGEHPEQRETRMRKAIAHYYERAARALQPLREQGIPVMATGHATLGGADIADGETEAEIGNIRQIDIGILPGDFDYVALGHLHMPQVVGTQGIYRYAGSPYTVNFGEAGQEKSVMLLDFKKGKGLTRARSIPTPVTRRLLRYTGSVDGITRWLETFDLVDDPLSAWLEIHVHETEAGVDREVRNLLESFPVEVLKVIIEREEKPLFDPGAIMASKLEQWKPVDVFQARCRVAGIEPESKEGKELATLFKILVEEHAENG